MTPSHDDEADDLLIDHLLQQSLGDEVPPDLSVRIAGSSSAQRAAAARAVDGAAERSLRRAWFRPLLACAGVAAAAIVGWWASAEWTARQAYQAQVLLDEFHRVMPYHPEMLRDPDRRRQAAAEGIPVIRRILEMRDEPAVRSWLRSRACEFELFAVTLGDLDRLADLRKRSAAGEHGAQAVLAAASVITDTGDARTAAIDKLRDLVQRHADLEPSLFGLLRAAALSPDETRFMAAVVTDPALRRNLMSFADAGAGGPAQLLGRRLDLFGRLFDDRLFSSNELLGRPVLVCVWATWCRPSVDALDEIRILQRANPQIAVLAISCDNASAPLWRYLQEHQDRDWYHLFDRTRPGWHDFAATHGVRTIPTFLLVDETGVVRGMYALRELPAAVHQLLSR